MKKRIYSIYLSIVRGSIAKAVGRFVSPLFLVMLFASSIFWFVTKLGHTYTDELEIKVKIEDQAISTKCVVEGVGTNLLGYHIYNGTIRLSLDDLHYRKVRGGDGTQYIRLDKSSLFTALSVHCSDIKIVSIENPSDIKLSERIEESINKE